MRTQIGLALATTLLFSGHILADDKEASWIHISGTSTYDWYGQKGSGTFFSLGGKPNVAYGYLVERKNIQTNKFEYYHVFVKLSACKSGYGYLISNDMQGNFLEQSQFVRFGPTVTDALATVACQTWDQTTQKVSLENDSSAWNKVATAERSGDEFALNVRTFKKSKYKDKPALTSLYRIHDKNKNTYDYGIYSILQSDCQRGFGTIRDLKFDNTLVASLDVSLRGQSVISSIADALCKSI